MAQTLYAMPTTRIYAEAYELKAGGFRGVAAEFDANKKVVAEILKSDLMTNLQDARIAAIKLAHSLLGDRPFRGGSYRNSKRSWKFNYWLS